MKKLTITILVLFGFLVQATASNPVTLTDFHATYKHLDEVLYVLDHGQIDGKVISFLADQNNPIDEKAAIINALVVNNKTKSNALTFKQFMARKYKENWENLDLDKLNAEELFCLGYMTIMDEGGNATNGLPILELAVNKSPSSYTINLFKALASAEISIRQGNPCEGWTTFDQVKSNGSLNIDLDPGISNQIADVMESYKSSCD